MAWCRRVRRKWTVSSNPLPTVFEIPHIPASTPERAVLRSVPGYPGNPCRTPLTPPPCPTCTPGLLRPAAIIHIIITNIINITAVDIMVAISIIIIVNLSSHPPVAPPSVWLAGRLGRQPTFRNKRAAMVLSDKQRREACRACAKDVCGCAKEGAMGVPFERTLER